MDTLIKCVLVFGISVFSFGVGTYVGHKVAESDRKRIEATDKILGINQPDPGYQVGQCLAWEYHDEFEHDVTLFYVHDVGKTSYMLYRVFPEGKDTWGLGRMTETFGTITEQYKPVPCP